jgi:hypothetical protein
MFVLLLLNTFGLRIIASRSLRTSLSSNPSIGVSGSANGAWMLCGAHKESSLQRWD